MSLRFSRDPLANPEALIRRVYAYVAYRLGDGPDAEDVTSEVFERALRYRESYDRSKGEPIAWLLGIAQPLHERVPGGSCRRAGAPDRRNGRWPQPRRGQRPPADSSPTRWHSSESVIRS